MDSGASKAVTGCIDIKTFIEEIAINTKAGAVGQKAISTIYDVCMQGKVR